LQKQNKTKARTQHNQTNKAKVSSKLYSHREALCE